MSDIVWSYRNSDWITDRDLVGYAVEASDGPIGSIDEASTEASASWLVVDTGFWIFGKRRLIPAGTVVGVDHDAGRVIVGLSKEQVKGGPDYDADDWDDDARRRHADHYEAFGR